MKYFFFLIFLALSFSCKTNRFKENKRVGLWIVTDTIDGHVYESRGKYKKGNEQKTWKYLKNGKLYKKEIYRDSTSKITFFHDNGHKMLEGNAKLTKDNQYLHWFYQGQWIEYNNDGKFVQIRQYEKGELINQNK